MRRDKHAHPPIGIGAVCAALDGIVLGRRRQQLRSFPPASRPTPSLSSGEHPLPAVITARPAAFPPFWRRGGQTILRNFPLSQGLSPWQGQDEERKTCAPPYWQRRCLRCP